MSDFDSNNSGPEFTPEPDTTNYEDQSFGTDPAETYDQETTTEYDTPDMNDQDATSVSDPSDSIKQENEPELESSDSFNQDNEDEANPTDTNNQDTIPVGVDYNNQIMQSQQQYKPATYETGSSSATMPRSKVPVWLFIIAGGFVAIFLIIVAFMTIPTLSNAFALATMSPAKYYAKVEKANMNGSINAITEVYGKTFEIYTKKDGKKSNLEKALKSNIKINVSKDITAALGIGEVKTIEANVDSAVTSGKGKSTIEYLYDNKTLATLNVFADVATNDTYIQIKELSNDYLILNQDSLANNNDVATAKVDKVIRKLFTEGLLSDKLLNTMLKKYGNLAINEISDVSLKKKAKLEAGDISTKNTKIIVSLSQEDLVNMLTVILEKAKDDKEIIELCEDSDLATEKEYEAAISLVLAGLEDLSDTSSLEEPVEMVVWVNNKGIIIGREFHAEVEGDSVDTGFVKTTKSSDTGYKAWITSNDIEYASLEGTTSNKGKAYSGDATLSVTEDGTFNYDFDISYEDFKLVNKEAGYFNGEATITSDLLSVYSIKLSADAEKDKQDISFVLLNGKDKAVSVDMSTKETDFKDFDLPDKKDSYDFLTEMDEYTSNADVESFLANIQSILNIEGLNDYISSIMNSYGGSLKEAESLDVISEDTSEVTVDTPETTSEAVKGELPEGVEPDESGYYSYEVDYDTIMAAGEGSTGYAHMNITATSILKGFEQLVKDCYKSDLTAQEPTMYNNVSGSVDENYPYENTYYTTTHTWYNEDNYTDYVQLTTDTVTDQIIEIRVSDTDDKRGQKFITQCFELLDGSLSSSDKDLLKESFKFPEDEDYLISTFKNYEIYYAEISDGYTFTITPAQ